MWPMRLSVQDHRDPPVDPKNRCRATWVLFTGSADSVESELFANWSYRLHADLKLFSPQRDGRHCLIRDCTPHPVVIDGNTGCQCGAFDSWTFSNSPI